MPINPEILTRWSFNAIVNFYDGDLGRGVNYFGSDPIVLEVLSKGAVVTTYKRHEYEELIRNSDGVVIGREIRIVTNKCEATFVDRIEFRLSFKGLVWSTWYVQGDSFIHGNADATIDCSLFTTTVIGGW